MALEVTLVHNGIQVAKCRLSNTFLHNMQHRIVSQQKQLNIPWGTHTLSVRETPTSGPFLHLKEHDISFPLAFKMGSLATSAFGSIHSLLELIEYLTTKP